MDMTAGSTFIREQQAHSCNDTRYNFSIGEAKNAMKNAVESSCLLQTLLYFPTSEVLSPFCQQQVNGDQWLVTLLSSTCMF